MEPKLLTNKFHFSLVNEGQFDAEALLSKPVPEECLGPSGYLTKGWLSKKRGEDELIDRNGIYIWLLKYPSNDGHKFRFVHVGSSAGKTSSLRKRTQEHCRNSMTKDKHRILDIKKMEKNEAKGPLCYVSLGGSELNNAKRQFEHIRILYLTMTTTNHKYIEQLEGHILEAALDYFPSDPDRHNYVTNSSGKARGSKLSSDGKKELRKCLNKLLLIFDE